MMVANMIERAERIYELCTYHSILVLKVVERTLTFRYQVF